MFCASDFAANSGVSVINDVEEAFSHENMLNVSFGLYMTNCTTFDEKMTTFDFSSVQSPGNRVQ